MVPFVDLKTQYRKIGEEVKAEIEKVLIQANFILGEPVNKFEKSFSKFCDTKYCIGVASGTDALSLSLKVLDIGEEGDEVITAANTFIATVLTISYVNAKPVLVDIAPDTYNIDLESIEDKITENTKAIIPVHLYGRMVDMDKVNTLADKYNLKIIEDACQAHGALFKGKKAGSFSDLGCFSFYPSKNLGAYGDGEAIVTSDEELYQKLKMLRNYGSSKKYYHDTIGYNSRLDTIQAAVLSVKLKYLAEWNKRRFACAKIYNERLKGIGDLVLPDLGDPGNHVFHLYVIRTSNRDALLKYLNDKGVQCGIHYPVPIYSLGAYSFLNYKCENFPITEKFSKQIISLPIYPELSKDQIDEVVSVVKDFYKEN